MKIAIFKILVVILFISACSEGETETYGRYIELFQRSIEIISSENKQLLAEMNRVEIDISDYYLKYINGKLIPKDMAEGLIQIIDSLLTKNGYVKNEHPKISGKENSKLENETILTLKEGFSELENAILRVIDDTLKYENLVDGIKKVLSTSRWAEINTLSSRAVSKIELISVLLKLKLDLVMTESDLISFIFSNITSTCFKFSNIEPYVIPNSIILPVGKPYRAEIIFASYDTIFSLNYEIDGKYYECVNGNGLYRERVVKKSGEVVKHGLFKLKNPRTGKSQIFPFTIQYQVLKKK